MRQPAIAFTALLATTFAITNNAGGQQSSAEGYGTIVITNNNSLPISRIRIRAVNTKGKWYQLMPITDYLDEGRSKTFRVSTDHQCKYTFVVDYINGTMSPGVINFCGRDKTIPLKITYTGIGGTHDVIGKYIGDNPDCQPINGWVSGIMNAPKPLSCR